MPRKLSIIRTLAALAAASAILCHTGAQAAPLSAGNTVIMLCHESGGSGLPLTDYINNMDVASFEANGNLSQQLPQLTPDQRGAVFNLETSSSPTSCAIATAELVAFWGYKLTSVFSHLTGHFIEVFRSPL